MCDILCTPTSTLVVCILCTLLFPNKFQLVTTGPPRNERYVSFIELML